MRIGTLENITKQELLEVHNLAFSDYLVPFQLTMHDFENRIKSNHVKLELSAGAFENNKLIGFILHGIKEEAGIKEVYNAGTGVVPYKRGQHITSKLYDFIIPLLQQNRIAKITLEVISENIQAIKAYQSIGFGQSKTLNCYKGSLSFPHHNEYVIESLKEYDWALLTSFWDWQPSWQNSIKAVTELQSINASFGVYAEGELAGYVICNMQTGRIQQFAIKHLYRRKGLAKFMFEYIAKLHNKEIVLINIDAESKETLSFIYSLGLNLFASQYEMMLEIK